MLGYQVIFYVQQDQKHKGIGLSHWLLHRARELNIGEAALFAATLVGLRGGSIEY